MNIYPNYLFHHGIEGQKWGIRRYQNEDGTLTPEGRIRYKEDLSNAKREYKKAYAKYNLIGGSKNYADYMYKKREYDDLKNSLKFRTTKKDKRQLKFEEEYIKKGMRKEDAELQAYKRRKTEKVLLTTAGITATAIAGIAAYKIYKNNADRVIKKGTKLHHIVDGDFRGVEDAFVARNTMDRIKYRGVYGKQLKARAEMNIFRNTPADIKDVTIEAKSNVKIASRKNAKKIMEQMFNEDPDSLKDFYEDIGRVEVKEYNGGKTGLLSKIKKMAKTIKNGGNIDANGGAQSRLIFKAKKDIKNGKITDNVYDAFNMHFVGPNKEKPMFKKFANKLNSHGYGAILDMNDYKYSGYAAKDPLILIDRHSNFSVKNIRKVKDYEIERDYLIGGGAMALNAFAPLIAAGGAAKSASNILRKKSDNELVAKYQREHPGTKKTYNEILRDVYQR